MLKKFLKTEEERGLKEKTLKKYETDIKQFLTFIDFKTDKDILDIDEKILKNLLKNFIKKLEKENYKPTSINSKLIVINKFLRFLGNDCRGNFIKIQKKTYIDNVLSEGDYRRLLEACGDNYRDKCIIMTLANTGMRVSELLSLKINDVSNYTLNIKGKKDKYREIFIADDLRKVMKKYINCYRLNTDDIMLFTGKKGALQRQAINKMLFKYAQKGHVKKNKSHPHSLRHFFGKRLAQKGVSLDVIQTYLGHDDIATTAIYTKRTKEELKNTLDINFIV